MLYILIFFAELMLLSVDALPGVFVPGRGYFPNVFGDITLLIPILTLFLFHYHDQQLYFIHCINISIAIVAISSISVPILIDLQYFYRLLYECYMSYYRIDFQYLY